MSQPEAPPLELRGGRLAHVGGAALALVGALFVVSAPAADEISTSIVMVLVGLTFALGGVLPWTAKVTVSPGVLTVRNYRTTQITSDQLTALLAGSVGLQGRGATLLAHRRVGRPVKLLAFSDSTDDLEAQAERIMRVLCAP